MFIPDRSLFDGERASKVFDMVRLANNLGGSTHPVVTQSIALDTFHDVAMCMAERGGESRASAKSWAEDIIGRFGTCENEYGQMADESEGYPRFLFCEQTRSAATVDGLRKELQRLSPAVANTSKERTTLDFATAAITDGHREVVPHTGEDTLQRVLRTVEETARQVLFRIKSLEEMESSLPAVPDDPNEALNVILDRHYRRVTCAASVGNSRIDAVALWQISLMCAEELLKAGVRGGIISDDMLERWVKYVQGACEEPSAPVANPIKPPKLERADEEQEEVAEACGLSAVSAAQMAEYIQRDLASSNAEYDDDTAIKMASQVLAGFIRLSVETGILNAEGVSTMLRKRIQNISALNALSH